MRYMYYNNCARVEHILKISSFFSVSFFRMRSLPNTRSRNPQRYVRTVSSCTLRVPRGNRPTGVGTALVMRGNGCKVQSTAARRTRTRSSEIILL